MDLMQHSPYAGAYASLSRNRIIFLSEEITKTTAATLCSLLIYYNAVSEDDEIRLLINTPGGDASALTSICDVMSMIKAPVSTVGIGKVYSAGAFILSAGSKGQRYMFKNAEVLIHGLQCSFPEIPASDQTDAANYFSYLDGFNKKIMSIMAKNTKKPLKKIMELSQRDLYLDATEAKAFGLIDDII